MAKPKERKSRDELIKSGIKMYKSMMQYRAKYEAGELTDEDIFIMASDWADKQIALREERLAGEKVVKKVENEEDAVYRENQEKAYREKYVWEDANDEASLQHLLNLEVQAKRISEELESAKDAETKQKLRKSLTDTVKEHRTLQEKLGIDRLSRAKAAAAKSTVDDWERIKQEAKKKLDDLAAEFSTKADKVTTEAELRDRMKYHFAIPFIMVDSILVNHRRVLGLDQMVEKS